MRTVEDLAKAVNAAAKGRPIGSLQTIRLRNRRGISIAMPALFSKQTIFTNCALHAGESFDRLRPLYEFVESIDIVFPESPSRSGTFKFKSGHSVKPAVTSASVSARTLDVQLRHNQLQLSLYRQRSDKHGDGNVGTEVPNGCGGREAPAAFRMQSARRESAGRLF